MLGNFINVSQQVIILFIFIFLGVGCTKLKILNGASIKSITTFVLYVVTACVIIHSFDRPFDSGVIITMAITTVCAVFSHVVGIVITKLVVRDKDESRRAVLRYGTIFANCGFMALPLQYAILGSDGVLYGAIFIAVFNIMAWTYGVHIMNKDHSKNALKKAVLNPGTVSMFVGLVLFFTPLSLPMLLSKAMEQISYMNTTLPMIIIGYFLATTKDLFFFRDVNLMFAMVLRLVVIPLFLFVTVYLCGVRGIVLVVVMIAASTPSAANTVMFAELFDRDVELAAKFVSISTLLSILTMPPIISFAIQLSA